MSGAGGSFADEYGGFIDGLREDPAPVRAPEGEPIPGEDLVMYRAESVIAEAGWGGAIENMLGERSGADGPIDPKSPLGTFGVNELDQWQDARKTEAILLGASETLLGTPTGPVVHSRTVGARWPTAAVDTAAAALSALGWRPPAGTTMLMTRQHRSAVDALNREGVFRPDPRWGVPMFDIRYHFAELAHAVRCGREWWERLVWGYSDVMMIAAALGSAGNPRRFALTGLLESPDHVAIFAAVPDRVAVHVPFLVWDSGVLRSLPYRADPADALARGEDAPGAGKQTAAAARTWAVEFTQTHDPTIVRHQTAVGRIAADEVFAVVTYDDVGPAGLAAIPSDDEVAPRLLGWPRNYPKPGGQPLA